uniref:Uncharacterized protein n=1 Tax=Noccaea caerulescens TaxID=107243 RepID=A0A1J3JY21_NOCCA
MHSSHKSSSMKFSILFFTIDLNQSRSHTTKAHIMDSINLISFLMFDKSPPSLQVCVISLCRAYSAKPIPHQSIAGGASLCRLVTAIPTNYDSSVVPCFFSTPRPKSHYPIFHESQTQTSVIDLTT